jgi:hypothetical protein
VINVDECDGSVQPRSRLWSPFPGKANSPTFDPSQIRVIPVESCGYQRVNRKNHLNCRIAQNYAVLPAFAKATARQAVSESVRKFVLASVARQRDGTALA